MEIREDNILNFDNDFKPANYTPKANGYYMTIRCGLEGIYYRLDEYKDGRWQLGILDGSYVIAYSKETISKEVVNDWARKKLEKILQKQ